MVEALFAEETILNSFWSNRDRAADNVGLLLKFAFNQVKLTLLSAKKRYALKCTWMLWFAQAKRSVILFRRSLLLISMINNCCASSAKDDFLQLAISLANETSMPEGMSSKSMFEALSRLRYRLHCSAYREFFIEKHVAFSNVLFAVYVLKKRSKNNWRSKLE